MKIDELMIQNAVRYNGSDFKVTDISRAWPMVEWKYNNKPVVTLFDGGIFTVGLDEIDPIPITEEWLTKQGFKREYEELCEYTYYIREIDGYFVEVRIGCSNMSDEYVNCHIDNCDRTSVASADIRYLHQLQNLLNLMNIKFDIEL
jgi:hypothetical protein